MNYKIKNSITAFFMGVFLITIMILPITVKAANSVIQNGIEVSILTDKSEYSQDDEIEIGLNIKNTNSYKVEGLLIETVLPEELELKTGNLSVGDIQIEAGKEYATSVIVELSEELRENPSEDENIPTENPDDNIPNTELPDDKEEDIIDEEIPNTGDASEIILWVTIEIVAIISIVYGIKNRKSTKIFSLFF